MRGWGIIEAPEKASKGPEGPNGPRDLRPPRLLRLALTAAMLGTVLARAVHIRGNPESVAAWYSGGAGPVWGLLSAALFLGPFAAALAAAMAPWVRGRAADYLWYTGLCGGFFALGEGLTLFARSMDGHHAYVGAEPLLSLLVFAVSGFELLIRRRASFRRNGRRSDSEKNGDRRA